MIPADAPPPLDVALGVSLTRDGLLGVSLTSSEGSLEVSLTRDVLLGGSLTPDVLLGSEVSLTRDVLLGVSLTHDVLLGVVH